MHTALIQTSKSIIYHPEDLNKILTEKGKGQVIYRIKSKDGSYKTFQDEATFVYLSNKPHIYGAMKDITEKIKMEKHLRRDKQLENIGVFAGGLAHDFNNYLTGIYNYLEILRQSSQNPTVNTISTKILNFLDKAKGLTNRLLTFSKGGEPVIKVMNLKKLVK